MLTNARSLSSRAHRLLKRSITAGCDAAAKLVFSKASLRRRAFRQVYRHGLWGSEPGSVFYSGQGSRGESANLYVERMSALLLQHASHYDRPLRIVDLGCGDFEIGRRLVATLPDVVYVGCDIVPELIEQHRSRHANERVSFQVLDIVTDPLPAGDVCLIRQVLQHNSNADIAAVLSRLTYPHIYVTEGQPAVRAGPTNPDKLPGADVRFDWRTGRGRGVELDEPPYCLSTERVLTVERGNEIIVTERLIQGSRPSQGN